MSVYLVVEVVNDRPKYRFFCSQDCLERFVGPDHPRKDDGVPDYAYRMEIGKLGRLDWSNPLCYECFTVILRKYVENA